MKLINKIKKNANRNSRFLSFYMAIGSMLLNLTTPFFLSYTYVAHAEDTSAPVSEDTATVEQPKETAVEESSSKDTSSETKTTEEPQASEPAVTTDEQNTVVDETPTEKVVTEKLAVVETPAVNPVLGTGTAPETTPVIEPTSKPTSEPQGDILPDGVSDYRPETDVTGTETQQTQQPIDSTTLPSSSEPAVTEPSGTESSTTEPASAVSSSEPATEPSTPTEAPKEYETLANGTEIKNSVESDWKVDGNKAETNDVVKIGVKYIFPLEKDVTITFTKLPKLDSDRTSLKIEKVKVSDLNLPDEMKTNAEFAYDVTTEMKEGDFKYDITLPKPENKEVGISYIEKSVEEAKTEVKTDDVKTIDEAKVEQKTGDSSVTINDLDHFTIFIATYADLGLVTSELTYLQGDTVYASSTALSTGDYYRIDIIEQDGSTRHQAAVCTTGATSLEGSYALSVSAPVGTNWKAEVTKYNNLSDCNARNNIKDTGTKTFEVKSTTPTSLSNPTISQTCGLDIALVIDNSNSIDSTELSQMKAAMTGFVNALAGTPTQFSVTKFGTNASVVHGFTSNTADVISAINSISTGGGGTNWKEGISTARGTFSPDPRPSKPNLMIFASDGNPTFPSCGGAATCAADVNSAVTEANTTKQVPIRILALGIGEVTLGPGDGLRVENLKAISGHVVNAATVLGSDVVTTDFSTMASQLADFASQTCGGTITVNKVVTGEQSPTLSGWHFTINGHDYVTDAQGFTQAIPVSMGTYSVIETTKGAYTLTDKTCTKNNQSTGSPITNGVESITVGDEDIISCTFTNNKIVTTGTLTIRKVVVDSYSDALGPENFYFNANFTSGARSQYFDPSGQNDLAGIPAGGYNVTEDPVAGYTATYNNCNGTIIAGQTSICTITNTRDEGTITVTKHLNPTNNPGRFNLSIDNSDPPIQQNIGHLGTTGGINVITGNHTVSETAFAGTNLSNYTTNIDCGNKGSNAGTSIQVTVNKGDDVNCIITNTLKPYCGDGVVNQPSEQCDDGNTTSGDGCSATCQTETATLTVNKIISSIDPNDSGLFNLIIDGATYAANVGNGGSTGAQVVSLGSHTVSETAGTGTNLTLNYTEVIGGNCAANGTITLAAGESKICTITNTRNTGDLKVQKIVDDGSALTQWRFSLDGGASISADLSGVVDFGQVTTVTTHTITESGPNTYYFDSVSGVNCVANPTVSGTANATVAKNSTTTCIFSNKVNRGSITIIKDAIPDSSQDFAFTTTGGLTPATFSLDDDNDATLANSKQFSGALPGTYTISETPMSGWNQSVVVCHSDKQLNGTFSIGSAAITLVAGENITCTFTNTKIPTLTVTKILDPSNDRGLFNLFIDGNGIGTDVGNNFTSNPLQVDIGHLHQVSETAGTGTNLDNYTATYGGDCDAHGQISLSAGENKNCTITNTLKRGAVALGKCNDLNGDGGDCDGSEPMLPGWTLFLDKNGDGILNNGETSGVTDANGMVYFSNVLPGNYGFCEVEQPGWTITKPKTSNCTPYTINPGDSVAYYFANAQLSDIHGYKWNDLDGNGVKDENEPLLGDWRIFIDHNNNQTYDAGERTTLTQNSGPEYGWYWFTGLVPGSYSVCEQLQTSWLQTYPNPSCHLVTLPYNAFSTERFVKNFVLAPEYNFGNRMVNPVLHISKENNTGGAEKSIGDQVEYTIEVWVTQSPINDVVVNDLLPKGFKYVVGSGKAYDSNNNPMAVTISGYASPGTWKIPGTLEPGKPVTLKYLAEIQDEVEPGVYKDLAWTEGTDLLDRDTFGLADPLGYVDVNFVGTQVKVGGETQPEKAKVDTKINKEVEEVLGASTTRLPATGISPIALWLILGGAILSALLLIAGGVLKMIKNKKNLLTVLTVFAIGFFSIRQVSAAGPNLVVRIEDPASPVIETFNLTFVVMDLEGGRSINAECFKKSPSDSGWVSFESFTIAAGGGTENCLVDGNVLDEDGTYEFKAEATAGSDTASDESSVKYDGTGPGRPKYIEKDKKSDCKNEITFRTADDHGQTKYVEVYKDTDKEFTVKDSNRIKTINIGSDEKLTFTDEFYGSDCGRTWYYGVRAFDSSGNASKVRSEDITETTTKIIQGKTTEETIQGAIPSGGQTLGTGTGAEGAKVVLGGSAAGSGQAAGSVLGQETAQSTQSGIGGVIGAVAGKWWLWIPGVAIILAIANEIRKKRTRK